MKCRKCGMQEGEPYNGSANCIWYGPGAYANQSRRELANMGCFMFKDYRDEDEWGHSHWEPCFRWWPRKLIDGRWGWGQLESRRVPMSDYVPRYIHGSSTPMTLYRERP